MHKKKILCIGACHMDHQLMLVDQMAYQTSNPVYKRSSYGGVIRNVGENLAYLNRDVYLMSLLGQDMIGKKVFADTAKIMHMDFVDICKDYSTGEYIAVMNPDGDMDLGFANMAIYDAMDAAWIDKYVNQLMDFQWLVADMNIQADALSRLMTWAKTYKKKLAIIGVSEPKMIRLPNDLDGLELLILNMGESKTIFKSLDMIEDHVKAWLKKGVKHVVITQGEKDTYFGSNSDVRFLSPIPIKGLKKMNMTGAGDAFSAGVIYGMMEGNQLERSIQYGLKNAYLTIQEMTSVNQNLSVDMLKE